MFFLFCRFRTKSYTDDEIKVFGTLLFALIGLFFIETNLFSILNLMEIEIISLLVMFFTFSCLTQSEVDDLNE